MTNLPVDPLLLQLLLKIIVLCNKTVIVTYLLYLKIFKCTYHVRYIVIGILIIQFCISFFWRVKEYVFMQTML